MTTPLQENAHKVAVAAAEGGRQAAMAAAKAAFNNTPAAQPAYDAAIKAADAANMRAIIASVAANGFATVRGNHSTTLPGHGRDESSIGKCAEMSSTRAAGISKFRAPAGFGRSCIRARAEHGEKSARYFVAVISLLWFAPAFADDAQITLLLTPQEVVVIERSLDRQPPDGPAPAGYWDVRLKLIAAVKANPAAVAAIKSLVGE